ncbi:4577_t:CDS:2 [Entrophospora sp. SA101]|nr:4577_t:CDS:2 [Entrophospora sp. SA101]
MSVIPTISEETGNFPFLQKFLKEAPLEEITISRILHETWRLYGFQTNNDDCARIVDILTEVTMEINEQQRKLHLEQLQDIDKVDFDVLVVCSWLIPILKGIDNSHTHPQSIRFIIHLSFGSIYDLQLGGTQKRRNQLDDNAMAPIKNLCSEFEREKNEIQTKIKFIIAPSQVVYHDRWVEAISVIEGVARGIIVFILEEIRMDIICRISGHSEGTYMEMIGRLIDITMCESEQQSVASKNRKIHQGTGSRGNNPDIMIRAFFQRKWNKIAYVEGGRWDSDEKKRLDDHNSLVRFCSDGNTLIINGLTREKGARFNFPVSETTIPLLNESVQEVEDFVHALLTLRVRA